MAESAGGFFQILKHDYYEQANGIQLEVFYINHVLGILQQSEELK